MSRYQHQAKCECDCGDCGGVPQSPLVSRPPRWRTWLQRVALVIGLGLFAFFAATLGCALAAHRAEAQQIRIDTSTAQYRAHSKFVDSLATHTLTKWVAHLGLPGWRITLQADTITNAIALTYHSDVYKNAKIVVDLDDLSAENADEVILHEVWHIKLARFTTMGRLLIDGGPLGLFQREEEALVTELTRMMLWR